VSTERALRYFLFPLYGLHRDYRTQISPKAQVTDNRKYQPPPPRCWQLLWLAGERGNLQQVLFEKK